jgi:hypothetical protein
LCGGGGGLSGGLEIETVAPIPPAFAPLAALVDPASNPPKAIYIIYDVYVSRTYLRSIWNDAWSVVCDCLQPNPALDGVVL